MNIPRTYKSNVIIFFPVVPFYGRRMSPMCECPANCALRSDIPTPAPTADIVSTGTGHTQNPGLRRWTCWYLDFEEKLTQLHWDNNIGCTDKMPNSVRGFASVFHTACITLVTDRNSRWERGSLPVPLHDKSLAVSISFRLRRFYDMNPTVLVLLHIQSWQITIKTHRISPLK